ncbi:MAG TPA: hypothetical protein VL981_07925 [Candidatus Methylacidiphilales bacterium]|nr:hypothetical protein [Candidatus Methylacidiphilales bacterium]
MSDLSPHIPAPVPEPKLRICWLRVWVYLLAIFAACSMWMAAGFYTLWHHPIRVINKALDQLPFLHTIGRTAWIAPRVLEIHDLTLGDFFYVEKLDITVSIWGLLRNHVQKVELFGPQLYSKAFYTMLEKVTKGSSSGLNWTIDRIEINRGTLMLNYLISNTSIPVRLGVRSPLILNHIKLNKPDENAAAMNKEETLNIENVVIVSPFDALAPVLSFPLTRVRFTYNELWHHQIREVEFVRPVMFLGQDLFWFTDAFKKGAAASPTQGVTAPWHIGHLGVQYGEIAVAVFGQPVVHFPFFYGCEVDDIRLDQLDKISVKSVIAIKRLNQDYPDYKIRIAGLEGRLYFSVPITANNVVNTISVDEVSWNNIPVTHVSSTVTFDPNGMYGKLTGKCAGGDLAGNFEFYYAKDYTWNVNFFAQKVNCQPIAAALGGKYLDLTGELDGKISVQGSSTDILNCQGQLVLPHPGTLVIKSFDNLLKQAPVQPSLKDQATKIAIEAIRTYPYQSGVFTVDYKPDSGKGFLKLTGPTGQRSFTIYWHPYGEADSSKVANSGSNR